MKKQIAFLLACAAAVSACPRELVTAADQPEAETAAVTGDFNADGVFSAADLVLLQKSLLSESGADLTDWQAGDLCADGELDGMDLSRMRQLLTHAEPVQNPLEQLKGMSYADAVSHGYISKAEYSCQISGGLKSSIESRMNRPIDNSIDRFYPVSTQTLGMDGTAKYLYNAATADVYPVIEETKQNCAVWYWKGKKAALYGLDEDPEKQQEFLDALEFYGVTEVYYSIGANKLVNSVDMVEMFVKNAYARNMKVYLLTGENTWLYEDSYQTAIYRVFDRVAEYNSMVDYDARLAGVSYDAEVWTNKAYNWKNNDAVRGQQVAFIQTAQQYADSQNLSVSFCLPFWIVRYHYTDANGETQNVYDAITKAANNTILMAYRDSAEAVERLVAEVQTGAVQTALAYAEQNDCNLEIAVQADENSEGDHVTFYEEETENPGCIKTAIAQIQSDLKDHAAHTTYAIHQATALYEFYLSRESSQD